ncbi:MAG: hypothetical protein LBC45_02345 [Chlamydiales bacterium]|jgi:hypothetical protein|nr:hypothetical protein [Chlamydiales bacterium]
MGIPNLNLPGNSNQAPCLDLVPANQLVVEPLCSWRLTDPLLELKVSRRDKNMQYFVYDHYSSTKCYWPKSASSPTYLTSTFAHCIWKGVQGEKESRLFSDGQKAVFVSVDLERETIGVQKWEKGNIHDFLLTHNPLISAIHEDHSLEIQEEIRETPRSRPYDPKAEEGMMRWRRTPRGKLVLVEGEPVIEETMHVWSGSRDFRLIKYVDKQREDILCRVFDWESQENLEVPFRFAPGVSAHLSNWDVDILIQKIRKYTPELENVENEEIITIYKEHPLNYFMPGCILSRVKASDVQRWVYEQFYRKEGESKKSFEYANFISAKKITFSFGKEKKEQLNEIRNPSEVETWHVEMTRQAAWALQIPIGMSHFFSGIFLASAQTPPVVDKDAMGRLVQGVPLFDLERNQIADDFAVELGACSTIHFYIACDRSVSQLEIDGRAWIRRFAHAGRDIRRAAETLAGAFGRVNVAEASHVLANVADVVESANRLKQQVQELRGLPPPLNDPEMDKKK